MTENDLLRAVTDIATIYGWSWTHFRAAQTSRGWRTPVQGPLGKGWPDLVLVRDRDHSLIFVELKSADGRLSPEQREVHRLLGGIHECYVWRPADLDNGTIQAALT
jgi:hypothetical protein